MKNTLLNMILVLGSITLIAGTGVGLVYRVTQEPIRIAKEANTKTALSDVLPEFDKSTTATMQIDDINMVVHTATKGGQIVGYAVETTTKSGFSGEFRLMVGFTPDGKVYNVKVLEHAETPGLGSKMEDESNPLFNSFKGKNPAEMKLAVTKDGGDVDILTAATITSRAYVDAVARAFNAMMQQTGGQSVEADVDAESGATQTDGTSGATQTDGTSGATQTDGTSGATQTDGTSGATQTDGTSGATQTDGTSGATQTDGTSGATQTDSTSGATEQKSGKESGNE